MFQCCKGIVFFFDMNLKARGKFKQTWSVYGLGLGLQLEARFLITSELGKNQAPWLRQLI